MTTAERNKPESRTLLVARALSRMPVRASVAEVAEASRGYSAAETRAELARLVRGGHAVEESADRMKSYFNPETGEESTTFAKTKVYRPTTSGAAWLREHWDASMVRKYGAL